MTGRSGFDSAPLWPVLLTTRPGIGFHMRIAVSGGRDERLLERTRRHPAQQVQRRARLVVGAREPTTAERLLSDDRAGGLVVDVEVARRESQCGGSLLDRGAILRDHGPGQCVRGCSVDHLEHVLPRTGDGVVVDVHSEDRAEIFGGERFVAGIVDEQHRGSYEPSDPLVVPTADGELHAGAVPSAVEAPTAFSYARRSINAPPKLDRSVTSP